ncbi:MAG: hypothetical protein DWQ19_10930 [Crenarchaeota archaeon]|nr:MAG: hypothetical protein DWQ19_10930 [Thermoproteota archaeon]
MIELHFKQFLETLTGRAAQKIWKPETPVIKDNPKLSRADQKKRLKGVHLNQGFRPQFPAPFKGLTADKFGIKVRKIPNPKK